MKLSLPFSGSRPRKITGDTLARILLGVCALLLVIAFSISGNSRDTGRVAARAERVIQSRMKILDSYGDKALKGSDADWMEADIPEDMVVYKYTSDSLMAWNNRFTVRNDEISERFQFQGLANPRSPINAPLADITEETGFFNLGTKWYLAKRRTEGLLTLIEGLEIVNTMDESLSSGINPRLHIGNIFSVKPLEFSGGNAVCVDGKPQFKIIFDSLQNYSNANAYLVWAAYLLLLVSALLFVHFGKTLKRFLWSLVLIIASTASVYLWGRLDKDDFIFSAGLYAGGDFLYSLGGVLAVNLGILCIFCSIYMMRAEIYRKMLYKKESAQIAAAATGVALCAGVFLYVFFIFRSIEFNSNICLELYKIKDLSLYSGLVYLSLLSVMMTVPLIAELLRPAVKSLFDRNFSPCSKTFRTAFSAIVGIFFVLLSASFGFSKEQNRLKVWANRLSVDRDITLEVHLKSVEEGIASDFLISELSALNNSGSIILNRITDNYLQRFAKDYDFTVYLLNAYTSNAQTSEFISSRMRNSRPIAEGSRFVFNTEEGGQTRYSAIFTYFSEAGALTHMLLDVEPKYSRTTTSFASLVGITPPGKIVIPARYSYARYQNSEMISCKGNYAYPTIISGKTAQQVYEQGLSHVDSGGFTHFFHRISDTELIVISRPQIGIFNYLLSGIVIALAAFLLLMLLPLADGRRESEMFAHNFYKSRVNSVLVVSLVVTMLLMSLVSLVFVYRRNEANIQAIMSEKISSVQALVEARCRDIEDMESLSAPSFTSLMEEIRESTGMEVILYSPDGRVFRSTAPNVLERMVTGCRINSDAYHNIVRQNRRYFIKKEKIAGKKYYSLYAPVSDRTGRMTAIINSPYPNDNYEFESDAVRHTVTIIAVFIILLILARFSITTIVDRMFQPLYVLGRKMGSADLDNPDYIDYDNDDEILSLVQSYNRMVHDLSESTKQLAQAERDKAWSAMARQVAHEIKNPLTPMKLQIQRLVRLKQKGDPAWQDKFDEVTKVVLDHIDILTDTANEFSTFAKLYTEDPTDVDLDALLQEEMALFSEREGIEFTYMGMEGTVVSAPKPQLTRVFVNLLTNSIQAIENEREEGSSEEKKGQIVVSLRNSSADGYLDIVFEDNGPGVEEENVSKLFTPNFTTKNSGAGLGLAICRSILEKCGATISYSRSFALRGACFKIVYPKK